MPNWCSNNLVLTHEDPAMIKRAYDALERGEFLEEFIPVPQQLKIVAGCVSDEAEQAKLEADTKRNLEELGYGNWYDYCCGEWGTKWDVGEQGNSDIHPDGKMLHTFFDSAWGPPVNAYEKLMDLGFGVEAMYHEGGMAFAGTWSDGVDDYVDLSELGADDIERDYPELDECFGISECMREYEAENEEELTTWIKDGADKLGLVTQ
jgi:hypothetical protein